MSKRLSVTMVSLFLISFRWREGEELNFNCICEILSDLYCILITQDELSQLMYVYWEDLMSVGAMFYGLNVLKKLLYLVTWSITNYTLRNSLARLGLG